MFTSELQEALGQLYPGSEVGGQTEPGKAYDAPRAYCLLAKQELDLKPYPIAETLQATGDSLINLGIVPGFLAVFLTVAAHIYLWRRPQPCGHHFVFSCLLRVPTTGLAHSSGKTA